MALDTRHPALAYATKTNIAAPHSAAQAVGWAKVAAQVAAESTPQVPTSYTQDGDKTTADYTIVRGG